MPQNMKGLIFPLLAILLSTKLASAEQDEGEDAMAILTKENFADQVSKQPHLVKFYAPWCGHCKRLTPTWEKLAVKYNKNKEFNLDITIAKVDCTVETALCSDQDVTGYPTLKFYKDGPTSGSKHRGERDESSLDRFIQIKLGIEVDETEGTKGEDATVEKGMHIINAKSFKKHTESGQHFIKFYAPWCGHCKKLAPTWEGLALAYEKDGEVKIGKVDCTESQDLCKEQGVRGYPTLFFFKNGKSVEDYKGGRKLEDLKHYVDTMKEKVAGSADAERVPTEEGTASAVVAITSGSFKDVIKSGVTFIKFFAPWCGHCKRLAPTWNELAKKFEDHDGVKIGRVDCTSEDNKNKDLCNSEKVNGFPTLNIYKNGEKINEYSGSRKLEDLEKYVKKHADAIKDEL